MKIFRLISASALALCLTIVPADLSAQHNGRRPGTSQQNNNRPSRPGNNGQRPGANGSQTNKQPGNTHNTPNQGNFNKPGNNHNHGNHNNSRPNNGNGYQPGNNHVFQPGHSQRPPQAGGNHNYRPGNNHGYQPGHNQRPPQTALPPRPAYRPHIPAHHSYNWFNRPVPPAHFRPHVHISPLQAIIGVALGTTLNITLNTLRAANYNIAGYQDNCLYLNDVNALGYLWPEATLYYSGGLLSSSTFSYYTPEYYPGRYNSVYQTLCRTYGAPVTQNQVGSSFSATWWGYDNRYISLEYRPVTGADGYTRYFTTLRMGN